MDGTNITTTYGVYGGEKMSPLGNAKQADATNLHGPGNGLDSQPGATTGHSAKPPSEDPKAFIGGILRDDWSGVLRLKSLRRAGRLPFKKEEMSSKEILDMTAVLEYDPFGVEIFKLLVLGENPKIDLGRLSAEDSHVFADKLLEQGLGGM
ncbi:MAG: hypothetical protein LBF49_01770, partial [Puniceicoccales bacterium]|nr:hypothetical protein [Puniceicoccales bacterium]